MKRFALILFLIITFVSHSQEDNQGNKLKYKSFSLTPLAYTDHGIALSGDFSFACNKHIFSLSAAAGSEIRVFKYTDSFYQINILYGREFKLNKTVFIDADLGFGYFSLDSSNPNLERSDAIGFPIGMKLRFKTGNRFSIGLNMQANINSLDNTYIVGIVLQWNRK